MRERIKSFGLVLGIANPDRSPRDSMHVWIKARACRAVRPQ